MVLSDGKNSIIDWQLENTFKLNISIRHFLPTKLVFSCPILFRCGKVFYWSFFLCIFVISFPFEMTFKVAWVILVCSQWQILKCHVNIPINETRNYSNMEILNATCEQIAKLLKYWFSCFKIGYDKTLETCCAERERFVLFIKSHVINHRYANDARQMYVC